VKVTYKSSDGKHFDREEEFKEYERVLPKLNSLVAKAKTNNDGLCHPLYIIEEYTYNCTYILFRHRKYFLKIADALMAGSREEGQSDPTHAKLTTSVCFTADDGEHFDSEEECKEYERVLPVLSELGAYSDELEPDVTLPWEYWDQDGVTSGIPMERYLFDYRKLFMEIAYLLMPNTHER
jgi:hypothetical protein